MFFRWDWLRPQLTAPIVPTLGPVHPDALTIGIFEDTLHAAATGGFLPYDKDRRWGGEKDEKVLREDVIHQPEHTLIPTLAGVDTAQSEFSPTGTLTASCKRPPNWPPSSPPCMPWQAPGSYVPSAPRPHTRAAPASN